MSNIKNVFDISGRAMASQLVRLNTVASNLANAGTVSGTKEEAFRSLNLYLRQSLQTLLKRMVSLPSTLLALSALIAIRCGRTCLITRLLMLMAMSIERRSMKMKR